MTEDFLEQTFPGHGRELFLLVNKLKGTWAYDSVAAYESKADYRVPYPERVAVAINEVIGGDGVVKRELNKYVPTLLYVSRGNPELPTLVFLSVFKEWYVLPEKEILIRSGPDCYPKEGEHVPR